MERIVKGLAFMVLAFFMVGVGGTFLNLPDSVVTPLASFVAVGALVVGIVSNKWW